MTTPKILLQFDTDRHASSFDAVVATDCGVDSLLQYPQLQLDEVPALVHGAMFTRGGDALSHTAIFIGGSKVAAAEALMQRVRDTFFGPMRVSVMFDASGCNTTAAAAVLSAMQHVQIENATAAVLGGTGPVGMRVSRLLAGAGCHVRLASRQESRAADAADAIGAQLAGSPHGDVGQIEAVAGRGSRSVADVIKGCELLFACGAAGVQLVDRPAIETADKLHVAIDLNAVPPAGVELIEPTDRGREAGGRFHYGPLGVGGLKMKIHRAALHRLFERNDQVLDAEEIFSIGKSLIDR